MRMTEGLDRGWWSRLGLIAGFESLPGGLGQAPLSLEGAVSISAQRAGGVGLPSLCSFSSSVEAWLLAAGLVLQVTVTCW